MIGPLVHADYEEMPFSTATATDVVTVPAPIFSLGFLALIQWRDSQNFVLKRLSLNYTNLISITASTEASVKLQKKKIPQLPNGFGPHTIVITQWCAIKVTQSAFNVKKGSGSF